MKGIKCNSNEVNAILAGDKSQIRLVIKPQPNMIRSSVFVKSGIEDDHGNEIKWPYQIGDLVFVKESFNECRGQTYYRETDFTKEFLKYRPWKPAQHMKQIQSRITLRIKDISVERLQDISEKDCWAEGVGDSNFSFSELSSLKKTSLQDGFANLWNETHKKLEEKWEANPWVWKIEFEVVKWH